MGNTFSTESCEPLGATVSWNDPQLYLWLTELRSFACDSNRTGKCELASTAQRETIDRTDRWLAYGFEEMKHALPEQRKFLTVYRGLLRQFGDVGAGHE